MSKLDNKICIQCSNSFTPRVKTATLCSKDCMYIWRKSQNWISKICLHCSKEFTARINDNLPRLFCSPECHRSSAYKKQKISDWNNRSNNPFKDPKNQANYRKIKMDKYGTLQVNVDKKHNTCIERYGTKYPMQLTKSNGKKISKIQSRAFKVIKRIHKDAILEHHLKEVDIFVDIYIPSLNKVIEIYGDYWHCNPTQYNGDYYNKQLHMTAQEKWDSDKLRLDKLIKSGYNIEIIWESSIRDGNSFK